MGFSAKETKFLEECEAISLKEPEEDDRIVCDFCADTKRCNALDSWMLHEQHKLCNRKEEPAFEEEESWMAKLLSGEVEVDE